TRAFQVLKGMTYLLIAFLLSQVLGLDILNWMLTKFFAISVLALVVIFQQELRQGFARLGQGTLLRVFLGEPEVDALVNEIEDAAFKLSEKKVGCLIGIEREAQLKPYIDSGIALDAVLTSEIVQTIFQHASPMHDGGVIVRGQRIMASACLFPLTENQNLSKIIGTRHRAALGITEQTDAVVVLVSEETGDISLAAEGRFIPVTGRERFRDALKSLLFSTAPDRKKNA
ncbi:MAG: TIGR00159 family protein, partial [Elusimicrobia bacterium]|nr:TIGR00159 family protein [Elusimicrobiota bacterium]